MSLPIQHRLEEVESILGSPPLSTESADDYHAMLSHYMNALKPRDFVLQMFVKDLADADWEGLRLTAQSISHRSARPALVPASQHLVL